MNEMNTTTPATAGFSLAALAAAAAAIAPKGKANNTIERLGELGGGAIALYIRLSNSDCKMDTRGRVRVALRALPECPAANASHKLGVLVPWADLPETVRAGASVIPAANGETAYYCTIIPRA